MLKSEEIIEVLADLNFWGRAQKTGIKRETYLSGLKRFVKSKTNLAVAITGVRRAGKTFLTKQLLESKSIEAGAEQTLYVLLEDPKFEPYLSTGLLEEIYQTFRRQVAKKEEIFLVLDEIQNVHLWEKWVRVLLEKEDQAKLVITGSSSKLLHSKLATILTGRTLTIEVFPLNFSEFLEFRGFAYEKEYQLISKKRQLEKYFIEYLNYGGFPQVVLEDDRELKIQIIKEIFDGIIYRDVVSRHETRDVPLVKTVAELALNNFSCLGSATRFRNIAAGMVGRKVSPNLILEILFYLEEAFLIFQVPIFSYKVKEQKLYPKKYYCIDQGILNAATFNFSKNAGRIYENIAAVHLFQRDKKENIFYWRSKDQKEVDFVIKEGLRVKELIQVCYDLKDAGTSRREIDALIEAAGEFECGELKIITRDLDKIQKYKGHEIVYLPLWKWLLKAV